MGRSSPSSSSRADLGAFFLVNLGLPDVLGQRRGVRGRRHLVRVIGVDTGRDSLLLGEAGQLIIVEAVDLAAVLPAVPAEPLGELIDELGWRVRILLRHRTS